MTDEPQHLDDLLRRWPYEFGETSARLLRGSDGREILQLRVDLGVLQLEATGRPDGARPGGCDTLLEHLLLEAGRQGLEFRLDESVCQEIDREFMQFFYRRICWLSLQEFERAVADADHSLALMDFSSDHAPEPQWAEMHEQYRPFVLFHRTQAATMARLQQDDSQGAIGQIDAGVERIREAVAETAVVDGDEVEEEMVARLLEMREAIVDQYAPEPPLTQQLADAIAAEKYELAAELRDKLGRGKGRHH